jgi:hyperosmotically inducible protein
MSKWAGFVSTAALLFAVACGQTDAGITTAVKSKLAADDTVKAYQVDVDTSNKVVTLSGDVETMAQKEHAVTIARNTDGVTDVIDRMRVNPTAATSGIGGNDVDVDARRGDVDVDVDVDDNLEGSTRRGAEATKDAAKDGAAAVSGAAKRGAQEVKEGARKVGAAAKDAVTDDDPDSDNDGK